MTIGIAVSGPAAGLAAFRALCAVEAVARGAIGGFVSFAAIDAAGEPVLAETQRGGSETIFGGGEPPRGIADARLAVLMSSGPDRPEPLAQFTAVDPRAGLLTGHRLPNMPTRQGASPYAIALARLAAGASPEDAVADALAADPEADAGLIAVDLAGRIALGNTPTVARRDDLGTALVEDVATGLRVGVLHNLIFPHRALACLAASAAIDSASPGDRADGQATLIGVPLTIGEERGLLLDRTGAAEAIMVTEPAWLGAAWEGSAVRRGDPVRKGGRLIGRVTLEPYCVCGDGRVLFGRGGDRVAWRLIATPGA